jgi:glycine/D-amino acid oxidase-like deaminating enzyme
VRNFGLVWVSGRAAGAELTLSLRARALWAEVAADCPGTGFRPAGSLTVATTETEVAALVAADKLADAEDRGFELLEGDAARREAPALGPSVLAALACRQDAIVEPRLVPQAIRDRLHTSGRYDWLPGREVIEVDGTGATDQHGTRHPGDLVVVCTGANHTGLAAATLAELPLRRRADGSLTIGDTHQYDQPFDFDYQSVPERRLLDAAARVLGGPIPDVARRWTGVYSQVTDDRIYARVTRPDGVVVVTGPGGRGMTLSPAIAEETFL